MQHHYGSDSDLGERPLVCEICDTQVGLDLDGNEFVPCECAFPICRKCYEYIREHDGGNCPQCREKYKRMAGMYLSDPPHCCNFIPTRLSEKRSFL